MAAPMRFPGRVADRTSRTVASKNTNGNMFESKAQRETMTCQGLMASRTTPMRAVRRSVVWRSKE